MKKILSMLLPFALVFGLAACGSAGQRQGNAASSGQTSSQPEQTAPPTSFSQLEKSAGSNGSSAETSADIPAQESGKTLIAYFSWSGNTKKLAEMIQETAGGDLFAIETQTPYSDDYNTVLDQAKQEQTDNARPALAAQVENMDDYDTVFIGYPNWWGDVPMAVLTFMESCDWSGKTVVPFCTSGGGGFGNGVNSIEAAAEGAAVLEGFHAEGSRVEDAAEDVAAWLNENGISVR